MAITKISLCRPRVRHRPTLNSMNLDEYRAFDATELARLVVEKEVTPVELLTLARRRAADVNPALNAIVIDIDEADAQAADPGLSGPFAGVPFLIKDLAQDYQGYPTSCGSRSLSKLPSPNTHTSPGVSSTPGW